MNSSCRFSVACSVLLAAFGGGWSSGCAPSDGIGGVKDEDVVRERRYILDIRVDPVKPNTGRAWDVDASDGAPDVIALVQTKHGLIQVGGGSCQNAWTCQLRWSDKRSLKEAVRVTLRDADVLADDEVGSGKLNVGTGKRLGAAMVVLSVAN